MTLMTSLHGQRILLGVSGGIAAYKSATLVRRLIDEGAEVRVVMTGGAQAFITPMTFQALSGNPVHTELLDPAAEAAMGHIELARWASLILIAPASANTIARLAHGLADDLLSTLCLASEAPQVIAPAMNRIMWSHAATQQNIDTLHARGVRTLGPGVGSQACGETGAGRMLEPEEIVEHLSGLNFASNNAPNNETNHRANKETKNNARDNANNTALTAKKLTGKKILITAGPTREPIDPVRFLSNRSSGKMGYAIATAASELGADVTLISGPVHLDTPHGVNRIDVITAEQMLGSTLDHANSHDIFISVAAVADYRVEKISEQKIKKISDDVELKLTRNPDILKSVAALKNKPFCVGFAAETERVEEHARGKLKKKRLDMIAANHVAQAGNPVFGSDVNALDVYWSEKGHEHIPSDSKLNVARGLLGIIAARFSDS